MKNKNWYVYILSFPDGTPFYVGKGTGDRVKCHERDARDGKQDEKSNIIRSIWKAGGSVLIEVALKTNNEATAYKKEKELILKYRTLHNLANKNTGVGGNSHTITRMRTSTLEKIKQIADEKGMAFPGQLVHNILDKWIEEYEASK